MDYVSALKVVQVQSPDMPFKEQQKKASEMYQQFKSSQTAIKNGDLPYATKPGDSTEPSPGSGKVTIAELSAVEKRIRSGSLDVNSIISKCREILPGGKLVNHGKDGVNSRVTFEDGTGNRIPVYGYFTIYI